METYRYFGFYRAKVLENKDPEKFGKIKVWIPDIMPEIQSEFHPKLQSVNVTPGENLETLIYIDKGIWAHPANNPLGGRSDVEDPDQWGQGCCYIPKIGSYVWIFFEGGNINRPWYFGSLDIETSKVLPENQAGQEYQNKWTIFKSSQGRTIVISDDCDERIEITGKKRKLKKSKEQPEGDIQSVYEIEGNQTTILLEETEGNEKLLIKTWKGDFINIDIEKRELHCNFEGNISIKSNSDIYIDGKNIHINSEQDLYMTSKNNMNISGENSYVFGNTTLNLKSNKNALLYGGEYTSIFSNELFLTGIDTIHQYTNLNLIGGKINVGLIVKKKANASIAGLAGESGIAGKPVLYGERSTSEECINNEHPDIENINSTDPITHQEYISETDDDIESIILPNNQEDGILPNGIEPSDLFDEFYIT